MILASTDLGVTWAPAGATLLVFGLVIDAAGRIIVTTPDGPQVSTDRGASFGPLSDAPNLYPIATSPDREQLIGVDNKGIIWTSATGDQGWRNIGTVHGSAQAVTVTDAGDMLVVDDSGLSLLPST